jgi:hypothetical protein
VLDKINHIIDTLEDARVEGLASIARLGQAQHARENFYQGTVNVNVRVGISDLSRAACALGACRLVASGSMWAILDLNFNQIKTLTENNIGWSYD